MRSIKINIFIFCVAACCLVIGCNSSSSSSSSTVDVPNETSSAEDSGDDALKSNVLANEAAYLPAQCYTKTKRSNNEIYNSCYTCHTKGFRPDFINDDDLQLEFSFPAYAETNHWLNLFKDRTQGIANISDAAISSYINTSNYFDQAGNIIPAGILADLPRKWDYASDGQWDGYSPDCYFNFDENGFDRNASDEYTGWRALAYYPFPATHWPTNGDYADVLIRLPQVFQTFDNIFDLETYRLNLAVLEALIKKRDVAIIGVDETRFGVDLDKNGMLGTAEKVLYDWAPTENRFMSFVGDALTAQNAGEIHLAAGLYPSNTEFLNTLRYVDVTESGDVQMTPRMKEIRYARKLKWLTYAELETLAMDEIKERDDFPDRLTLPMGNMEEGVTNGVGWVYSGFIEDKEGDLRPQTFEETASCIGCHGGIGATTDSSFAMARKLDAGNFQDGWFHWSQKDLTGINEPKADYASAGTQYEFSYYLIYAGAGDGFNSNDEVKATFFDGEGQLRQDMAEVLHEDISVLLYPSRERAMVLNKVYKNIVEEQSFTLGRTPLVASTDTVFENLTPVDLETGVIDPLKLMDHSREYGCDPCITLTTEPADAGQQVMINGNGMGGPNGERYQIDTHGFIDARTDYTTATKGIYFPFPSRHTLPTRIIVPLGNISACYECHRLDRPVPPDNPVETMPVTLEAATSSEEDLTLVQLTQDTGNDHNAHWSPDGSRIAWETDRGGSFQIWIMNSDGTDKRALTQGSVIHGWPEWSPDGSRVVCWGYDEDSSIHSISTVDVDTGDVVVIAQSQELMNRPIWHPDGTYIAWSAQQTDSNWDIWVANSNGQASPIRLTQGDEMESNPLWRPDGSFIAYKVAPAGEYNLTLENFMGVEHGFDSPTVREWDGIKSVQMNDWSPDGNRITYTAEMVTNASGEDRVSYLAVVEDVTLTGNTTSGTPVVLSDHNTLGDRGPVFSPDGTRIAFWSWDKSYRATLWVVGVDGSGLKQLTRLGPDMTPQWHPRGDLMVFESARSGNMDIWTVVVE